MTSLRTLKLVLFAFFSALLVGSIDAKYFLKDRGENAGSYSCTTNTVKGQPFPSLIDVTTEDLAFGLETGLFTTADLVTAYIDRIKEVNSTLHMVQEINPDALAIAAQLDKERSQKKLRGPLHGIPILIKANIGTLDKMSTTAGSFALYGATLPRDSGMATKLRAAGMVILGKTNLSQWANYRSSNTSNGWSAYGDQTYGAYAPLQDPSGSSSGSGVSSSIGLAFAALGSETSGSILSPSQVNNLVGIKPTVGLTSRSLVIPISEHQDTVGPMARTVKDAAYVLQAIAGKDSADNYTSAIPFDQLPDYVAACKFSALQGKRIGIPRNVITPNNVSGPILTAFASAIKTIEAAGATIVDNTNFSAFRAYQQSNTSIIVLGGDFIVDLKNYLDQLASNPNNVHSLGDVSNFTHRFPQEDYPDRNTARWDSALNLDFNNTSPQFWAAYQYNLYLGGPGGVFGALKNYSLDALIIPTAFSPGVPALVGSPVVTVPLGFYPANQTIVKNARGNLVATAPNIPFGLSFLGAKWTEADLIGYAYAFEQRTLVRNRVQPYIVSNTELGDVVGF